LENLCETGRISAYEKYTILEMTKKVIVNIASKYANVQKGVTAVMGGKVLEHEAKTILQNGIRQGVQQGVQQGQLSDIRNLMDSMKLTAEQAMDALKIPVDEQEFYMEKLNSQK
jgi:hypothetical protein